MKILLRSLCFTNSVTWLMVHTMEIKIINSTALYFNSLQVRLTAAKSVYENPWLCSFILINEKRRGERGKKHWRIVSVIKNSFQNIICVIMSLVFGKNIHILYKTTCG